MGRLEELFVQVYAKYRKPDCTGLPYAFGAINTMVSGRSVEFVIKEYLEGETPTEYKIVVDGKAVMNVSGELEFYAGVMQVFKRYDLDFDEFLDGLEFLA